MTQTLHGEIDPVELGATLMHEHLFIRDPDVAHNADTGWDADVQVERAREWLAQLHAGGISTVVDLTVIGLGRSITAMLRAAEGSPVHVVAATGIYAFHDVPTYFRYRKSAVLVDHLVREIEERIVGSSVRAGVLKCATDVAGVTPGVEKVLRAVAKAHRRTGVPISTHTDAGTRRGLDQLRIFDDEGVDPSRVVIGHSGDSTDLDYLEQIAATGAYLGMDRFGLDPLLGFEQRVDTVAELCRRGRADRMVLSHDVACYTDSFSDEVLARAYPNWHPLHISRDVLPALRARGVTEQQIEQMLIGNPRTILAAGEPY